MDQAAFTSVLVDFQCQCRAEQALPDLTVVAGRPDAPLVVLIHGIGGNARHWTDPVGLDPAETWLFDLGARPEGGRGIASSPPYQPGSVTPWTRALGDAGLSCITWSQGRADDLLQYAVTEATGVLAALEARVFAPYAADVAANGGAVPPLVLLCHSRGGLVARAALKQLGEAGVPHLRRVITLSTPHHGSYMPKLAATYSDTLSNAIDFGALGHTLPGPVRAVVERHLDPLLADLANRVRVALLHSFGTLAQGPGFPELDPQSTTLAALADGEGPLPGVRYIGFGGTDPTFIHYYLCEAGQTVHLLATASAFLVEQLARLPGVADTFGGLAELGAGDSAVGAISSQWPEAFAAPHQTFPTNHMGALIDPVLQRAVLQAIGA
jgi:pimeloyl-ACP methyl ester carboxylesterase